MALKKQATFHIHIKLFHLKDKLYSQVMSCVKIFATAYRYKNTLIRNTTHKIYKMLRYIRNSLK
jgi:hypothetical protein